MKKATSVLIATVLLGSAYAPTVKAQNVGFALDPVMLNQTAAMGVAMQQIQRNTAPSKSHSKQGSKTSHTAPKGSTQFHSNFAVRKRNLAQFVAKLRAVDPQSAGRLQQTFAKSDPIAAIAPGLRRYGLRTDDVADAAAAYLVTAWYGARGRNDDPSQAQVRGVREQMRLAMLSVPAFVSASDAAKQQMAEAMLVQMMIADALVTSAKGKPAEMTKVKAAIGQGARSSFHLDLVKMKLTESGLRL